MSVSYVERDDAGAETLAFYDKAEDRFEMLLNIFKVFGHTPELGTVFTDLVMAILKDGEIDWLTKELIILKATHRNECQYCVVQHETLSKRLGISEEKIADIGGDKYKTSPHFTEAEKALSKFLKDHEDSSQRLVVAARQMLAELENRQAGRIGEVVDLMHYSGRRLTQSDTSDPVRDRQQKIIDILDRLIKDAEEEESSSSSSSGSGGGDRDGAPGLRHVRGGADPAEPLRSSRAYTGPRRTMSGPSGPKGRSFITTG